MKYYLIVGEASGDLHASRLMQSLRKQDPQAEFRFFGGDLMAAVGGTRVKHYKELAYMGFVPVLLHLPAIFRNMKLCKEDIVKWHPDVVILVDYPGFNLSIAKFVAKRNRQLTTRSLRTPVYYYISPKIWAWKEWRIRSIKRDVDELFSILPFEVDFYEKKHRYPIHYVGNPTKEEVDTFLSDCEERSTKNENIFISKGSFDNINLSLSSSNSSVSSSLCSKSIIALLAGSRKQEIKDNLPAMIEATKRFENYELVLAGAPSIEDSYYEKFIKGTRVKLLKNDTYNLLSHATAALVTSGTATLEAALFNVPQVVCYETPLPKLIRFAFNHVIKVKYISLVNLIADREVVPELLADRFRVYNIANELYHILPGQPTRERMLQGYAEVRQRLGSDIAPERAAAIMVRLLKEQKGL